MERKTMVCFGDSNTYGYDPRNPLGSPYGPEDRWVDRLAARSGWKLVNMGVNGRTIPQHNWEYQGLEDALDKHAPVDYVCIMLGTNDALVFRNTDAEEIAQRMEKVLDYVGKYAPNTKQILLSPTKLTVPDYPQACEKADRICELYAQIARRRGIPFCDVRTWDLPMASDGVHLSPEGQRAFAEKFYDALICKL